VVAGDGAAWIWKRADEHLPDAIQIVDTYHAKEHVGNAARAIFDDADLGQAWSRQWRDELDQPGGADRLARELKSHAGTQWRVVFPGLMANSGRANPWLFAAGL